MPSADGRPVTLRQLGELPALEWPGDHPTVVCLPGLGGTARSWHYLAGKLPSARVIAPELRGRGEAAAVTGGAGLASHARDVARIIEQLDLSSVVVGHSMGAFLAPLVAVESDRVQRLVLIDGGVPPKLPSVLRPWSTRLVFRRQVARSWGPWSSAEAAADASYGKSLTSRPDLREEFVALMEHDLVGLPGKLTPAWDRDRIVADAVDSFFNPVVRDAFEHLAVPAHLLWCSAGKHDKSRPMYRRAVIDAAVARQPLLTAEHVAGANHVTLAYAPELIKAIQG